MNRALPLLLVPLCGCSLLRGLSASDFQQPSLSFKDASLSDVTLGGATVNLTFTVQNPNSQGISLAETDYKLSLEGKQVVAGKPPGGLKIPGGGSSEVTLPAQVRFSDLSDSIVALLKQDVAHYRAEGHIGVDTPLGVVPLPFAKEGTLPLPKLPSITLDSPRISNLSLTQATLEVPLTLANPNVFPLPVGAVAGNLSIEGAQVGRLSTTDVGRVDARGSRTIQVPVTVRFADAYAAARALREGKAHVALDADLSSGGASVPFHVERDVDFTR